MVYVYRDIKVHQNGTQVQVAEQSASEQVLWSHVEGPAMLRTHTSTLRKKNFRADRHVLGLSQNARGDGSSNLGDGDSWSEIYSRQS